MNEQHVIVFDWGGVILRICRSMREACVRAGLPEHLAEIVETIGSGHAFAFQTGDLGEEQFTRLVVEGSSGQVTPRDIERMLDAYLIEEYQGVPELIRDIKGRGHVTALLSNTNERHYKRRGPALPDVPWFPSVSLLDHHVASHLARCAKPHDEIYQHLELAAGAKPEMIVFFDDLAENVGAAGRRGWRGFQVDHTGDTAGQMRAALVAMGLL